MKQSLIRIIGFLALFSIILVCSLTHKNLEGNNMSNSALLSKAKFYGIDIDLDSKENSIIKNSDSRLISKGEFWGIPVNAALKNNKSN